MKRVVEILWVQMGFFWTQIYYNFFMLKMGSRMKREGGREGKKKEI